MERNKAVGEWIKVFCCTGVFGVLKACDKSQTTKHCGLGLSDSHVHQLFAGPVYLD